MTELAQIKYDQGISLEKKFNFANAHFKPAKIEEKAAAVNAIYSYLKIHDKQLPAGHIDILEPFYHTFAKVLEGLEKTNFKFEKVYRASLGGYSGEDYNVWSVDLTPFVETRGLKRFMTINNSPKIESSAFGHVGETPITLLVGAITGVEAMYDPLKKNLNDELKDAGVFGIVVKMGLLEKFFSKHPKLGSPITGKAMDLFTNTLTRFFADQFREGKSVENLLEKGFRNPELGFYLFGDFSIAMGTISALIASGRFPKLDLADAKLTMIASFVSAAITSILQTETDVVRKRSLGTHAKGEQLKLFVFKPQNAKI